MAKRRWSNVAAPAKAAAERAKYPDELTGSRLDGYSERRPSELTEAEKAGREAQVNEWLAAHREVEIAKWPLQKQVDFWRRSLEYRGDFGARNG